MHRVLPVVFRGGCLRCLAAAGEVKKEEEQVTELIFPRLPKTCLLAFLSYACQCKKGQTIVVMLLDQ